MPRRPPPDARRLAWEVLAAVEQGAFADAALAKRLRGAGLDGRDRGLVVQLVYGTLAWQALLDHLIGRAAGRDPGRIDEPLRVLLRLAFFQLVKLERVPEFAAVDTAVELSKTIKGGAASGLVNAALRSFLRRGKSLDLPPRKRDLAGHLAVAQSHPRWLVERWLDELGPAETEALLAANNSAAPTVLRVNRRRTTVDAVLAELAARDVEAHPARFAPAGVVIELAGEPSALPHFHDGWFAVQGEASQLVGCLVGARPGERVLDLCAAPGGKAIHLAEQIEGSGVVALDRNRRGLLQARRDAARLGAAIALVQADGAQPPLRAAGGFDAVLVDAPCSGLGTLRQHPEIRWRRQPHDIEALAALQQRLLAAAAGQVRPGGRLVYATCTIGRAENDDVVARFLAEHPEFAVDDAADGLPAAARVLLEAGGTLRTWPHRQGLDGFFAMRLKRLAGSHMVRA
ncbi:MAG: 16S rRNA (cytosine(967)-C(5))-methyltransferase RsmB [Candidatus Binatia bacterium]